MPIGSASRCRPDTLVFLVPTAGHPCPGIRHERADHGMEWCMLSVPSGSAVQYRPNAFRWMVCPSRNRSSRARSGCLCSSYGRKTPPYGVRR